MPKRLKIALVTLLIWRFSRNNEEARKEMPGLFDDDTIVLLTASTHDRPLGGVIGEMDAKSVSEAQRIVDDRLAITCKFRDAMASAQDKQKQYADQHGRKKINTLVWGTKCY
ncbi:hypothetical protein DD238_008424 [Peronospora effusa]|uniref:Uncharacterized protein n=1 Tax=Peronospora effusa TaxID=542832 RepID=A0A3M6V8A3_9STRA|nr:hypothetical protein DD238_008424 [Peronospora effusa]